MKKKIIITIIVIGVIIMSVYAITGNPLNLLFNKDGDEINTGYDISANIVYTKGSLPIPSGDLTASQTIPLPDIYGTGKGFTCTGLAYDAVNDIFLVGDIGKPLPNSGTIASQIVKLESDFETVAGTINLNTSYDVQGITLDSDGSIWYCLPSANKIYHISSIGTSIGNIAVTSPTGIAYSASDDSFWVLNYSNQILHINKSGTILESFNFAYSETLDQCFLDDGHGYLYITAGVNYSGRNNVYRFNVSTHEQDIACTVDSYSIEGIWIGEDKMVIVNDGYYHSAYVPVNQTNIYTLN